MLMTAEAATKLFKQIAKRDGKDSYVLVFYCEMDDEMSTAADEIDRGEANGVEAALASYLDLCRENIPTDGEDDEDDEDNEGWDWDGSEDE